MKLVLFICPHYNKCGLTDLFQNFFSEYKKSNRTGDINFKVLNYFDEFNHLKKKPFSE